MKYERTILLKNGQEALVRNSEGNDGAIVLASYKQISAETDYLLTYPDEITFTPETEAAFLQKKADSDKECHIIAIVDDKVVAMASLDSCGSQFKVRHRAGVGVSVLKEYCNLGLGSALLKACIQCAKEAGYSQIILNVISDNTPAVKLYKKLGFVEFGRNPKGLKSRDTGYQELIYMSLDL